jgi:chorismate lyase
VPADRDALTASAELAGALTAHGGTVTELLERRAGEPVDAQILSQGPGPVSDEDAWQPSDPPSVVLRRAALLVGRDSGRRFVYAESEICSDALPAGVGHQLESTDDPIGRVLTEHRVPVHREVLPGPLADPAVDRELRPLLERALLSRRYRIVSGNGTAVVISEWFLASASASPGGDRRAQPAVPP